MSNLIAQLGHGYARERLAGCMFMTEDDRAAFIDTRNAAWTERTAPVSVIGGPSSKTTIETRHVPHEYFKDFSTFATPALGWRMAANGRWMGYMRRNNASYNRALAAKGITTWLAPTTQFLINSDNLSLEYYQRPTTIAHLVMLPEYMSMADGLAGMASEKMLGFALSSNMAVIADTDEQHAFYFNTAKVGTVALDGTVTCKVPMFAEYLEKYQ